MPNKIKHTNSDKSLREMPRWLIITLILSTLLFIGFMLLMGAMLSTERG